MFMWHHMTPGEFFAKGEGEQKLLYAFTAREIEYRMEHEKERTEAWGKFLAKIHGAKIG